MILANGETVVVNPGYRISAVKIFDGKQEICFDDTLQLEEYTLDKKGYCYQFAFSKTDKSTFAADELCRVIKSFVRNDFIWNNESDIDSFVAQGTYNISGVSGNLADGLPKNNTGAIRASLTVLSSDECITQILTLLNAGDGDGNVFIRNRMGDIWGTWGKLQANIEVGEVDSLDSFIDKGVYSGVWRNGFNSAYPVTFVCITLSENAVNASSNRVSQLVYGLSKNDGAVVCRTRVGQGNDTVVWGTWKDVNEDNIKALLQGTSEKSSAWHDAFKHLGDFQSMDELLVVLDALHGTSGAERDSKCGFFSARIPNARFFIINSCVNFFQDNWQQCIIGNVYLKDDGTIDPYLDKGCGVLYRTHIMPAGYEYPVDPNNGYAHNWSYWKIANSDHITATLNSTAQKTETELVKRIQGTSDNSSAWGDAFRRLPDYTTLEQLDSVLRNWHGETVDGTQGFVGNFRTNVAGIPVEIFSTVLGYGDKNISGDTSVWIQEIKGAVAIDKGAANHLADNDVRGYTDTAYTSGGRTWYSRSYKQGLRFVSALDVTGIRTLRRTFNGSLGGWGEWIDVANPYITSPLYGKNVLILGGSFAHNMQAYMSDDNVGFGFNVEGRKYAFQNYIAKELGLKRFDNFAVATNGACIANTAFSYNIYTQLENAIACANANGYKYDAIILAGGINDYQASSPLGVLSEPMCDDTFYGSYKKIINKARTYNPYVKLFMTTPFKAFHLTECWNSTNTTVNSAGHKYYEYLQALKDIAQWASIPLLDIFAIQQVDLNNYGEFYRVNDNDAAHPNGKGYKQIAPAMLEFLAWGKGMETFDNEALTLKLNDNLIIENLRAEKAEAEAVEKGKQLALRALYVAAGAEYNDTDEIIKRTAFWGEVVDHLPKHYYLNGLGDIGEEEMMMIYRHKDDMTMFLSAKNQARFFQDKAFIGYRTLFGFNGGTRFIDGLTIAAANPFASTNDLEIIKWLPTDKWSVFSTNTTIVTRGLFFDIKKVRVIDAYTPNASDGFHNAYALEYIRLYKLKYDVNFCYSKNISKESVLHMIQNATPTSAITITLHADAYARLADDVDIVAALEAQPLVSLVSA